MQNNSWLAATLVALFLALPVGAATSPGGDRFAPRAYRTARGEVPVHARHDALTLRLVAGADPLTTGPTLVEQALGKYGVFPIASVQPLQQTRAVMVAWDGALARADIVALAAHLQSLPAIERVWPVASRGEGWVVTDDQLVVTAKKGRLPDVLGRLQKPGGLSLVRLSRVPDTALLAVGPAHGFDAIAASAAVQDPDVVAAEPLLWRPYTPRATVDDPRHDTQWHLNRSDTQSVPGDAQIFVHAAWDITKGSPDVTIAVFDSGIEVDHEDLFDNFVGGFDAVSGDSDPSPECVPSPDGAGPAATCPAQVPYRDSHGTAVSGTIAAVGDNGIGVAGVCPQCSLYGVRFLGGGLASSMGFAESFITAVDDGADIINNSWGPGSSQLVPLAQVARDAYVYARTQGRGGLGTVILFAAGNDTADVATDAYAAHPYAIAVAASTNLDDWAYYSNYGAQVDIAAPSHGGLVQEDDYGISTTDVTGGEGYADSAYHLDFGGTSAACPVASGVAGLMLSANPNLTAEQVRLILAASADKIVADKIDWEVVFGQNLTETFAYGEEGHSIAFGWGRVNAAAALVMATTNVPVQGGACTDDCASCGPDGTCQMACTEQSECWPGTICDEDSGACVSPAPGPGDTGEPCSAECDYCTPAIDTNIMVTDICTNTCETEADCPGGFTCRLIDGDGTRICAVGGENTGARNYYRDCRFGQVVRDEDGKGYCSEACFGFQDGDCPYGFECGTASCECLLESPFGCFMYECFNNPFGGWDTDVCFPVNGYGVTCTTDVDCGPGDYCSPDGTCQVDDRAGCDEFCQPCESSADCGVGGRCIQGDDDPFPWCSHGCETDRDCPGNTVCGEYKVGNNRYRATCRAPQDAPDTVVCDPTFKCEVACREDVPCADGETCTDGVCEPVDEPEPTAEPEPVAEPEPTPEAEPEDQPVDPFALPWAPGGSCGCTSTTDAAGAFAGVALLGLWRRRRRR